MSMRHYYYISKSKLEMLKGQIETKPPLSRITPKVSGFKVGVPGVGVELDIESATEQSGDTRLARDMNNLIDFLNKKNLVRALSDPVQIGDQNYYRDIGDWSHGLYSVRRADKENYTITYMLWKASGNRLFLLFGSPMNVLGANEVHEGMEHKSSSSSIINNVIETSLQDEFIGALYDCGKADTPEKPLINVSSNQDPTFKINVGNWAPSARFRAEQKVLRGSALALLCQQAFRRLPNAKIETIFKIYHEYYVSRSIAPFDRLYLGSPIYTALP